MKSALRFFYIALVGVVVFMGALYIAEGMRMHEDQPGIAAASDEAIAKEQQAAPSPLNLLDQEEGSAL